MLNKLFLFMLLFAVLTTTQVFAAQNYNSNIDLDAYGVNGNVDAQVDVRNVQVDSEGNVDLDIDVKSNFKGNVDGQEVDSSSDSKYKVSGNVNEKLEVKGEVNSERNTFREQRIIDLKNNSIKIGERLNLSNGKNVEVKIMPSTASQTAIERLQIKVCSEENNCTIVLKEVGNGNQTQLVYEVKAEKNFKVLALFKAKAEVNAQVDVESGAVIKSKGPWWSFIASSSD